MRQPNLKELRRALAELERANAEKREDKALAAFAKIYVLLARVGIEGFNVNITKDSEGLELVQAIALGDTCLPGKLGADAKDVDSKTKEYKSKELNQKDGELLSVFLEDGSLRSHSITINDVAGSPDKLKRMKQIDILSVMIHNEGNPLVILEADMKEVSKIISKKVEDWEIKDKEKKANGKKGMATTNVTVTTKEIVEQCPSCRIVYNYKEQNNDS